MLSGKDERIQVSSNGAVTARTPALAGGIYLWVHLFTKMNMLAFVKQVRAVLITLRYLISIPKLLFVIAEY